MRKKFIALGLIAVSSIVVLACAPISEEQCHAGSWEALGLRDGSRGATTARFASYAQECAEYGIRPDQAEWLRGHAQGVKNYCTPQNAYAVGRAGRGLSQVCKETPSLKRANRNGLVYHELQDEIDDLEDERDEIRQILNSQLKTQPTQEDLDLRRRYLSLYRRVIEEIIRLEARQRALPRY